jgi:hypothetical protein
MAMSNRDDTVVVTIRKGLCYLTGRVGRKTFAIIRIREYAIDAQEKRDMRRFYPDIIFDWKKIARQLAEKREVCRQYRARRQGSTRHLPEPFYGVVDRLTRTVYVRDPSNIGGLDVLLDAIMQHGRR